METYREFWHKKYGLRQHGVAVRDSAVETPVGRCTAEGGPENCSNHGPKLRRYDEQDGDIKSTSPSRLPNDTFDDGVGDRLPRWFKELYGEVAAIALRGGADSEDKQDRAIERFARDNGMWDDDLTQRCKDEFGERFSHGMESDVYDGGDSVVKMMTLRLAKSPVAMLERIALHNRLFPNTQMQIVGFGRANRYGEPDGKLGFLIRQRKVEFDEGGTTTEDVAGFMKGLGFKPGERKSTYVSQDGSLLATDMHRENVVKTKDGKMAVLDSLVKINYDAANPPEHLWTPKADKQPNAMDSKEHPSKPDTGDMWEIPGTGMSSDEWHRRRRAEQYAAEGLDPRRLDWKKLNEQSMRLRAQRRRSGD